MKCYKKIEIADWKKIADQTYNYILTTGILKKCYSWNTVNSDVLIKNVPELIEKFEHFNLKIKMTAIIYRQPFYQGGIHIDSGKDIRALIPIKNYEGSYTKFFDVDKTKIVKKYGKDGDQFYQIPDSAILNEIDSIESNSPFFFNPQIPHGVFTNPKCCSPRITLTIGFDRSPEEFLQL